MHLELKFFYVVYITNLVFVSSEYWSKIILQMKYLGIAYFDILLPFLLLICKAIYLFML